MPSTMETFAKMAGVKAMAGGGIEKITKIISGEAKMERNLKKRQAAEAKDQKALIIAEELDIHRNWLREKGSLIQAVKDHYTQYDIMSKEEREQGEEERIQKVKDAQKDKELRHRIRAQKYGGMKEDEWIEQSKFNEEIKRSRQAEKDLKKKEKSDARRDAQRVAETAADYERLGAFGDEDAKQIAARIRKREAEDAAAEKEENIATIQEKFSGESKIRLKRMVANLKAEDKYSGDFKDMDEEDIILAIEKSELTKKQNERLAEIATAEELYLNKVQENNENAPDNTGPDIQSPDITGAPGAGFGGGAIVDALMEQTDEIIYGLGNNSPPYLQTLTKDGVEITNPPSVKPESIGVESAPATNGVNGSEVSGPELITAEEPLPIESETVDQLLEIEKEKLDIDKARAAREVKAAGRALEDRRDKMRPGLSKGGPSLNKVVPEKGGGFLSTLGKIFMSPLGRIGTAIASLTGATTLLTGATGILSTATTGLGNFANKLLPNWMKKMLPAPGAPPGAPTLNKAGRTIDPKTKRFVKGAKDPLRSVASKGAKAAGEATKHASKIGKIGQITSKTLGRVALPLSIALEAFNMYSTEQREDLDRTEKNIKHAESAGGIAGATGGAMAGAAIGTAIFPGVGTILGGLIGGGLGYFLGGEISKTVAEEVSDKTDLATGDERLGELPEADQKLLMREAEKKGAVDVGLGHGTITDLEKLAKLDLSSIESLLDQETWSKKDHATLKKLRESKKEGRTVEVTEGSWWEDTDDVVKAGQKGSAGYVKKGAIQEKLAKLREEKKSRGRGYQRTDERKRTSPGKLSPEAGDAIAQVRADQEDKEQEELQAKADSELSQSEKRKKYGIKGRYSESKVRRARKKMRLQEQAKQLKDAGRTEGTFKGGVLQPFDKSKHMEGATVTTMPDEEFEPIEFDKSAHMKGSTLTDQEKYLKANPIGEPGSQQTFEYGKTRTKSFVKDSSKFEPIDFDKSKHMEGATVTTMEPDSEFEPIDFDKSAYMEGSTLETLTPDTFNKLTPDVELQDNLAEAGTKEGSIFTHDTGISQALWDIWAEEKSFFDPKSMGTTVSVEGEKELPLAGGLTDSTDFAPQMDMFGNAGELMAPVPVIDVSPNAPEMGATGGTIQSGVLEQTHITKMMEMQKQADTGGGGGGNQMVNAPTTVNNDNSQMIQAPSSVHGPVKPGTGRG